jgi:hypothetical protein
VYLWVTYVNVRVYAFSCAALRAAQEKTYTRTLTRVPKNTVRVSLYELHVKLFGVLHRVSSDGGKVPVQGLD